MYLFRSVHFLSAAIIAAADRSDLPPGENLQGALQGCSEVDCPWDGKCKIEGQTFTQLGVTNFTSVISPSPFNWIMAGRIYHTGSEPRQAYEKQYYIGVPNDITDELVALGGCALFFPRERFGFQSLDRHTSSGTCDDALGPRCVDALKAQVKHIVNKIDPKKTPLGQVCLELQHELADNDIVQGCQQPDQIKWAEIQTREITGNYTPPLIEKGADTNCHPTSPSDSQLRNIFGYNVTDLGDLSSDIGTWIDNVVPVMTVFFPNATHANTLVKRPEVHLSCLKPTGYSRAGLESLDNGQGDDKDAAVGRAGVTGIAVLGVLVSFFITILT